MRISKYQTVHIYVGPLRISFYRLFYRRLPVIKVYWDALWPFIRCKRIGPTTKAETLPITGRSVRNWAENALDLFIYESYDTWPTELYLGNRPFFYIETQAGVVKR